MVLRGCESTLMAEAGDILGASSSGLPVESGALAASGFTDGVKIKKNSSASAVVGYESPHAAFAHEGYFGFPGVPDEFGNTGRGPKFLERALQGRGPTFARKIGAAMVAALKRSST